MTYAVDSFDTLPRAPGWVTPSRAGTLEDVAFLSGAGLSHLHLVLSRPDVPQSLLRQRLALRAAETCVAHSGRPERSRDLRDAAAFLQPGDEPGPGGEIYLLWQRAVGRPISVKALHRALHRIEPEQIGCWLGVQGQHGTGQVAPITRVATVLRTVLEDQPHDPAVALLLAEAALAKAMGWTHIVPLLALGLKGRDLRNADEELRLACHRAVVVTAQEVASAAADLTRRVAHMRRVAPKLRAKGAKEAVELFLSHDALAPTALSSLRSNRAARRFCDRLVELGAVRELTGRDTFRLYGI